MLLLLVGALSDCAYFNTYTNAKKAFKEAEDMPVDPAGKLTPQARRSYDTCVTKCQKLLDEFPDSKWVDEALFLMSKSYFRKKEYGRCLTRLDELSERFPEHPFREEALFLRGVAHLEREEESRAIAVLARLAETYPKSKHLAEAMYRGAEAEYQLGNWDAALDAFGKLLDRFDHSDWNDEARLKRGRIYVEREDHENAVLEFEKLAATARKRGLAFDGQMQQVESLIELRQLDEAHTQLDDMEPVAENFRKRAQVLLLRALVYEKQQRIDEALQLLEDVAVEFANQSFASEAWYRIGLLNQIQLDDRDAALESFGKAVSDGGRGIFRDLAARRKQALEDFILAQEGASTAEGDSSLAEAQYRLAENQFLSLEDPEAALEAYESVLVDYPESPWAPRAAYALCYIQRYNLADTLAALDASRQLLETYPESEAAKWVSGWNRELGGAP